MAEQPDRLGERVLLGDELEDERVHHGGSGSALQPPSMWQSWIAVTEVEAAVTAIPMSWMLAAVKHAAPVSNQSSITAMAARLTSSLRYDALGAGAAGAAAGTVAVAAAGATAARADFTAT